MLSLTQKRWLLPERCDSINTSHILARLFTARGIHPDQDIQLIPPSVYTDMNKAVSRIRLALDNAEVVGIFGDYDCDGVTAVAQLVRFFRRRDTTPVVRLPHRVRDGYGLHKGIVQEMVDANVTLLITADTGITSVEEIALLQSHGIDVVVTDHHQLLEELPSAYAIVHPAVSTHPLPHPSGSGVVFTLIHALEDGDWNGMYEDIALAMCGTVADLVELKGANRALTQLGLAALNDIHDGPLRTLRERCRSKSESLRSQDIAFRIAPRINAAGRMADPCIALDALLDGGDAIDALDRLNEERKTLTKELLERAVAEFDGKPLPNILISIHDDYPHGIVGLIAGRLTEQFGRPSLVAHTDGTTCTASLRSPPQYNIAEGLKRCSASLDRYGGHAQAAGCTFAHKNIDALSNAFQEDVAMHTDANSLHPTLVADACIRPEDITVDFCKKLDALEPYGQGNAEPLFVIQRTTLSDIRLCGEGDAHLQCRIGGVKAIGFNMATLALESQKLDILVRVNINEWQGKQSAQCIIVDMRLARKKAHLDAPFRSSMAAS